MIKDTNNNAVFINNDGDIEIMKNLESHLKISYDPNHDTDKPNVGMT